MAAGSSATCPGPGPAAVTPSSLTPRYGAWWVGSACPARGARRGESAPLLTVPGLSLGWVPISPESEAGGSRCREHRWAWAVTGASAPLPLLQGPVDRSA